MYKITQTMISEVSYHMTLSKLLAPNPTNRSFPDHLSYRVILLLGLTTGLPMEYLMNLHWEDVLSINSKGKSVINSKIEARKYDIVIGRAIHAQLASFYNDLYQPSLESRIIDSRVRKTTVLLRYANFLFPNEDFKQKDDLAGIEFVPAKLFGRRVIQTCGFTNETSAFLKLHFRLKTNAELFEFLHYDGVSQKDYRLSDISMIENESRFLYGVIPDFLDDNRNFHIRRPNAKDFYPFQHFQTFYDFLNRATQYERPMIVQGIIPLLQLSLINGVPISTLLRLKWSDLFEVNISTVRLVTPIYVDRYKIKLNDDVVRKLMNYFKAFAEYQGIRNFKQHTIIGFQFEELPNLNLPVFITNRGNPLTQPSLSREVTNALRTLEFNHADRFKTQSPLIMYGRRIVELKGNHQPTVRKLKEHFNYRTEKELFDFLFIDKPQTLKTFKNVFEHILYDI